jgi:hypothetical protein
MRKQTPLRLCRCIVGSALLVQASIGQVSSDNAEGKRPPEAVTNAQKPSDVIYRRLVRVETVQTPGEMAVFFFSPMECDGEGNLYLQTDPGQPAIHKLNSKGERVAVFQPTSNPDRKIDFSRSFAVAPSGELYELVFAHEITRYVYVYKSNGAFDSTIKLQPGIPWSPSTIAVFPSGQLLVSGAEFERGAGVATLPFTGIFAADGRLLKEIKLEDDETLRDMAVRGDARATSAKMPHGNRAVSLSHAEMASDGNAYLMRWTTPVIFYAISSGGEVVRRFTVNPPQDAAEPPMDVHLSENRVAILFVNPQTMHKVIKIVDLEGHEIATYTEPIAGGKPAGDVGVALACYTQNPDRFTFLGAGDDHRVQFRIAEGR